MQQSIQGRAKTLKSLYILVLTALLIIPSLIYTPIARAEDSDDSSDIFLPLVSNGILIDSPSELEGEAQVMAATSTSISKLRTFSGHYDYKVIGNTESRSEARDNCNVQQPTSSSLSIPNGSTVKAAYLYWSGSGYSIDSHVKLNGISVSAGRTFRASLHNGQTLYWYGAFADVTSMVNSSGTYEVGSLSWQNGDPYCWQNAAYGGWSLVVVYENNALPFSNINVYDGFADTPFPGTLQHTLGHLPDNSCSRTAQLTHVSWEGDDYKGEHLWINGVYKGNNTYNGSTDYNLDIDTYQNISLSAGQSSFVFKTKNYLTNSVWGNAIEYMINNAFVVKTNGCTPEPRGKIGDRVWNDIDGDGIQDGGEAGIANVGVRLLDGANNVVQSATTDNNGNYLFDNLPAGEYRVVVNPNTLPQNVIPTFDFDGINTPNTAYVTLSSGETNLDVDFGYNAVICANPVIIDFDTDAHGNALTSGQIIDDEYAAYGLTFTTNDVSNHPLMIFDSANPTGDDPDLQTPGYGMNNDQPLGNILIISEDGDQSDPDDNIDGGTITINGARPFEVISFSILDIDDTESGTVTALNGSTVLASSPLRGLGDNSYQMRPLPASNVTRLEFALSNSGAIAEIQLCVPPTRAAIGDRVWNDLNRNGIQDDGEPGVKDVRVKLFFGNGDDTGQQTTTDANGNYAFTNLDPDRNYVVQFMAPANTSLTQKDQGNDDAKDSNANPGTGRTDVIDLAPGENNRTIDAGLIDAPASIGDRVWRDDDGDGNQDANEPGIPGVTVKLLDENGASVDSATTDDNGKYLFSNLPAGKYTVMVDPSTLPDAVNPTFDADGIDTPNMSTTTLTPGQSDLEQDFGYQPKRASLGDKVWKDLNGNGIQEGGEPGVDDVKVSLFFGNGDFTGQRTQTANGGKYAFTDLDPNRDYIVQFIEPANMLFTKMDQGNDESKDSDAEPATGFTAVISLAPGENNDTIDAGLVNVRASIGDKVFEDTNEDGIQDNGEPGVPGVTVNLWTDDDNNGTPDTQVDSTTTDDNGEYGFIGLNPDKTYIVEFEAPAGREFTAPNQGSDDAKDSDANFATGRTQPIELEPGENDDTVDAGILPLRGSIGDRVWSDEDGDGQQDAGEPGISGVTVKLLDGNDNQVDSTTTDSNGMYLFSNLLAGTYTVMVDPSTLPDGVTPTFDADGTDTPNLSTTTLNPGGSDLDQDFGYQLTPSQDLSLGDTVFLDENNNGKQDAGEQGISGVAVKLYPDNNDNGSPDSGAIATVTTDGNGNYLFTGLEPGKYIVEIGTTNFNPGRPLEGLVSSNGGGSEPAPDPDNDVDGDDNGNETTTGSGKRVVRSGTIMLSVGDEPTSEDGDANTNLTLDFGFTEDTGPVLEASIDIEKSTNGEDADFPTGPGIPVGNQVNFEYVVTNDGDFDLTNVVVEDDQLGNICTIDDLPVGASTTCTAQDAAIQGQYSNIGTVTGEPVDENGNPATDPDGNPIPDPSDSDPSHYVGITPTGCVSGDMLMIEAEDGQLEGRFEIGDDAAASGGQFIHVPNGLGNEFSLNLKDRAEFCFTVSMAGTYRIKGLVYAETGLDNSFFVTVDGQPVNGYLWDFSKNTNYNEDFVSDRNGADPVEVELTPGDHIIAIYLREDGGRLDKLFLEKVDDGGGEPTCGGLIQEGEDGTLFGLFEIGDDPVASGGKFVHVPNGSGNSTNLNSQQRVDYCVDVPESGVYRIKANVYAASGADNSFFVQVDGSPSNGYIWDIPLNTNYDLDYVSDRNGADPVQIILEPGQHIVSVLLREDGARLDSLEVQKLFDTSATAASSQVHELGQGISGALRIESANGDVDSSDMSLSGITFTLSDAASNGSNYQATVQPDAQGRYSFDSVPVGEYILTVDVPNAYTTEQATKFSVSVTAERPVDISFDIMTQEMEHNLFLPVVTR